VEDGKLVAVRDSDDDDNESLESLTDIFDRKKKGGRDVVSSQTSSKQEEERLQLLGSFTGGRSNPILKKDRLRELQRLEQANNFDLSYIYEEDRKDEAARASIAKANAELETSIREFEESRRDELDRKLLAAILQGNTTDGTESEDVARLMSAVDRTEALSDEKHFSFFGRSGPGELSMHKRKKKPFPVRSIPGALWKPKDATPRDRAYVSGFITELAASARLDDEAVRWTFYATLDEQRDDIRQAYVNCITAASSRWTRNSVTPEDIQDIFEMLGTDPSVLRDATVIESQYRSKTGASGTKYEHLVIALKLLYPICQDMDFATLSKLCSIISRLTLDQQVMANNQVCQLVEDLLEKLVTLSDSESRQHIHERILSDLSTTLREPALQSQFLQHFVPTTPAAAELRSKLAVKFLLGSEAAESPTEQTSITDPLANVLDYLNNSPYFTTIRSKSDLSSPASFSILNHLTTILDATIANGHPPQTFADRVDEQAFNTRIDTLADHIQALFVSIADSGASHMRRTEAKDTLQALHYRLLFSVRTRSRRKKHVFDASGKFKDGKGRLRDASQVEEEGRGKDFMSKFLRKSGVKKEITMKEVSPADEFVDVRES